MFNYRLTVGLITILSGLIALACLIVGAMAVEFNFDAFSDPLLALNYAHNAGLARWFMLLDMIGYYLLLLPVIFYLYQQYKYKSPWTSLFTFSGLSYVLIGALGAVILSVTWPDLMRSFLNGDSQKQDMIALQFKISTISVTLGMWNILELLFGATWWMGMGFLLYRDKKLVGIVSIITGLSALIDGVGNMVGLHFLAEFGMNIYLLMAIVWSIVTGISIIKKNGTKSEPLPM